MNSCEFEANSCTSKVVPTMHRAVFLDRDGVINKLLSGEPPANYVTSWEQFEFLPGAKEALCRLLQETDYFIMVVSNQSGIRRGFAKYMVIFKIFATMRDVVLAEMGVGAEEAFFLHSRFDFYFCPHLPGDNCACRKPLPGLLYRAAMEHDIVMSESWMIGDSASDIRAGHYARIPSGSLLSVGNEVKNHVMIEYPAGAVIHSVSSFDDLFQAVEFIIENSSAKEVRNV